MRSCFRHVLALTVAFALVASAAAWRQCTGLQMAAAAASVDHSSHAMAHHTDAVGHGEHGHHKMRHNAADDPALPAADDHGCMKCCAMCTVANALLPAANATVIFTVSVHVFSRDHVGLTPRCSPCGRSRIISAHAQRPPGRPGPEMVCRASRLGHVRHGGSGLHALGHGFRA